MKSSLKFHKKTENQALIRNKGGCVENKNQSSGVENKKQSSGDEKCCKNFQVTFRMFSLFNKSMYAQTILTH